MDAKTVWLIGLYLFQPIKIEFDFVFCFEAIQNKNPNTT